MSLRERMLIIEKSRALNKEHNTMNKEISLDLIHKAYNDYLKLVEIVKTFEGGLEQLLEHLNGFNLMEWDKQFDCNFGSIVATVYAVNDEFFVYEYIDIYDDEKGVCIKECISYVDCKPQ